ncbi:Rhodanese-like domain-containing protein [Xylaria venustula]|nr:Rhodanese-like domain-containing protein [Xylaria venustula]
MSLITLSSLERITAPKLAEMLLASSAAGKDGVGGASSDGKGKGSIAIVDVRDDDHIGGHIRTSLHFPSRSLDATMPTLLRKLADKDTVVFHCALSQQRGPSAALQYLREKEAAAAHSSGGGSGGSKESAEKKKQKVYILDRGFVGWQEVYGPDERLTEAWRKELWEEGWLHVYAQRKVKLEDDLPEVPSSGFLRLKDEILSFSNATKTQNNHGDDSIGAIGIYLVFTGNRSWIPQVLYDRTKVVLRRNNPNILRTAY